MTRRVFRMPMAYRSTAEGIRRRWRGYRAALALTAIGLLLVVPLLYAAQSTEGDAPESTEQDRRTVSPPIYERLIKAKKLMDEGNHAEAVALLKKTLGEVQDSDYEHALTQQSLAYAFMAQRRYGEASRAMEAALAKEALPRDVVHALRYNLTQVYVQMEDYGKAHAALMRWLKDEPSPSADAHFLAAIVHHRIQQHDAAISHVQKAISKTANPREEWYQFLLSLLFERKRYQEALPVLKRLVARYPGHASYWRYLTDVYLNLKREGEALGVLRCAYHKGVLEENDRIRMAQLFLRQGLPYSAARLLEKEMARGQISRNAKNLELLGNSWTMAREPKRAIAALREAAASSGSGHLHLVIGQMQIGLEDWREASNSLDRALSKGGLKKPGEAQLLLGMSLYHSGEKTRATSIFQRASQDGGVRAQARRWLDLIDRERNIAAAQH